MLFKAASDIISNISSKYKLSTTEYIGNESALLCREPN